MATQPHHISLDQMIELLNTVAVLASKVELLTKTVHDQEVEIRKLIDLAERGKGSVWMLMAVGGVVGAALTNLKTLVAAFIR